MATPTEDLLNDTIAALRANLAAGGLSSFRENEDSASFHDPSKYAALLRTLANDEIAASINNSGQAPPKVFTYLC